VPTVIHPSSLVEPKSADTALSHLLAAVRRSTVHHLRAGYRGNRPVDYGDQRGKR